MARVFSLGDGELSSKIFGGGEGEQEILGVFSYRFDRESRFCCALVIACFGFPSLWMLLVLGTFSFQKLQEVMIILDF